MRKYGKVSLITLSSVCVLLLAREGIWHRLCYINQPPILQETSPQALPPALQSFFAQPMYFVGMGSQCVVFAPIDSPYVLKICKGTRYQNLFTSSTEKKGKLLKDSKNYKIAYEKLANQTGIVYLHLQATSHLQQKIRLKDPLHLPYLVDADRLIFYVQKRALPLPAFFAMATTESKRIFWQTLTHSVETQASLGILMKDVQPAKNIGVSLEGEPLWIDPGRMYIQDVPYAKKHIQKVIWTLSDGLSPWLSDTEFDSN